MLSTKLKLVSTFKRYSQITIESFDKRNPYRTFLSNFNKDEIMCTDSKILAHIISKNPYSFVYLPIERQYEVCELLDTTWFKLDILSGLDITLDKGIWSKYFGHIPLYVPFNKNKKQFS